ncbi:hypothetical protein H2248_003129 [Termitomyces sp. 'cryptogamus']|nr:hypothetical protein H2248_003129 [Termitomyces sp. 'cryptogamus']
MSRTRVAPFKEDVLNFLKSFNIHFASLFLATCIALRALVAPVPAPAVKPKNFELTNTILPLHCDHLSLLHHTTVCDIDKPLAAEHQGQRHCGSSTIDRLKEIVLCSPTCEKLTIKKKSLNPQRPTKSTPSQPKKATASQSKKAITSQPKKATPSQPKKATTSQPDIKEIKKHIHIGPDESLFYSGPNGYMKLAGKQAKKMHKKILDMAWTDRDLFNTRQNKAFWNNTSQAFAELSSGTVYVLLPEDIGINNFHNGTVWKEVEWPTLQQNLQVTKVIKVTEGEKKEVLLDRTGSPH